MVVAAFPLAKLLYLAVRQISKPIAQGIQTRAKASPFFRNYICMPPAQFYHWADVKIKMWVLNMGGPVKVAKLNEEQAIEQGAQILGELIIFGIAAVCLVADYVRSSRKEAAKETARAAHLVALEQGMQELGLVIEKQDAQIRQLTRVALAVKPKNVQISEYQQQEIKLDFLKDIPSIPIDLEGNGEKVPGKFTREEPKTPKELPPVVPPTLSSAQNRDATFGDKKVSPNVA